eukprot:3263070-Rhodomonas_salina.1
MLVWSATLGEESEGWPGEEGGGWTGRRGAGDSEGAHWQRPGQGRPGAGGGRGLRTADCQ